MARLIDANEITYHKSGFPKGDGFDSRLDWAFREDIDKLPTVDAVEVVHGRWKEYSHSALVRWKDGEPVWADRSVFRCSRCGFGTIAKHNYCPRCGAKMDGGTP